MSDVTAAARRYIDLLETERGLRRHRASLDCHHMPPRIDEEGMPPALHPDGERWQEVPCWTHHTEAVDDGHHVEEYPFGDGSNRGWCEGCRQRQAAHVALLTTVRKRVGALLTLRAAVRSNP
jgi:hypothetical protein